MVEMTLSGVILEPKSKSPIVVLKDDDEQRALLIWVGEPEANAILLAHEGIKTQRPLTHDLFRNTLQAFAATIKQVRITEVRNNTYFAEIELQMNGTTEVIDARPSDAIAMALRFGAPIFVDEKVMTDSAVPINQEREEEDEAEQFKKFLENVKPSDFGKFGGPS
ncbi:bifunctional nuclease family protein [bacterium]|nr:bifunctional nuclease family protein [bacterium]